MRHLLIALVAMLACSAFAREPVQPTGTALVAVSTVQSPLISDGEPRPNGDHECTCGAGENKKTAVCKANETCTCEKREPVCSKN